MISSRLLSYIPTVCLFKGHTIDVGDLTHSIAGFEESIRKCKAVLFYSFDFVCVCR